MGGTWSNVMAWRHKDKEVKILVIGMASDAENRLPVDQLKPILKEKVAKRHTLFTSEINALTMGGRCDDRLLRVYYMSKADGVIFMLDEDEVTQKEDAKFYITQCLQYELEETPIPPILIVVCKKNSVGENVSDQGKAEDLTRDLGLEDSGRLTWNLVVCDSEASESLSEGLGWLRDQIIKQKGGDEALKVMKLGKGILTGNHTSTFLQKMKHILSPSLTPA